MGDPMLTPHPSALLGLLPGLELSGQRGVTSDLSDRRSSVTQPFPLV